MRVVFLLEKQQPQSERVTHQIVPVQAVFWSPGSLPNCFSLADSLQTLTCQIQVWLANCKSPKIHSPGKRTLGQTSLLCLLPEVWAFALLLSRELRRRTGRGMPFCPPRVTVDCLLEDRSLWNQPGCASKLGLWNDVLLAPSLVCFEERAESRDTLESCHLLSQSVQGAGGLVRQGSDQRVLRFPSFMPLSLPPCCFAGSEADFSSSSSTGSISAPEVHMSAAGSKRSSFSRK